jgi:DNA-binding response OmpR family regulator
MTTVLIVEDDEAMSVALRDGFASEGYSVRAAHDGEAGLRAAQGEPFDLVILDVMLPGGGSTTPALAARCERAVIMPAARPGDR